MAWGIMMTAVMLLGMLGIAMFQATTNDRPRVKRQGRPSAKELKRAV